MCSIGFETAMILLLIGIIGFVFYISFCDREKCPYCGSTKIDVIKTKGNKITSKCRKCGKLSDRYESFY